VSDDISTLLAHQAQLESNRSNLDSWWNEIALRVLPSDAVFQTEETPGVKRTERMFDSSAATSLERFSAVMDDISTPRTQRYHGLMPYDDDLEDDQESKEFLERLNKQLFAMRYRPRANFPSQKHQCYMSLGAFGNFTLFVEEEVGFGPRYQHIHTRESFWAEDRYGRIDTHYRKFRWEARQAMQRWGNQLPESIRTAAEKSPFQKFTFYHCVRPNDDRVASRADFRGMPWSSHYFTTDGKPTMLEVGGYTSWPFAIGRYMLGPGETYARGPAMACWPAILTLNEEKKTVLRAGQKDVDPPVLLSEDGALEPFNLRSSALNYGLVSEDGKPLALPFKSGANVPLGMELMALERQAIEDSFLVTIFKVLVENPQMTATQVLEIAQQKAVLLAPVMGRQHSEDLGPMIAREIDILARDSRFAWIQNEMPDQLRESDEQYKIEYSSPLARAMRAHDGVAILRTAEAAEVMVGLDKNSAYVYDWPGMYRKLGQINGVPAELMRDKRAVAAIAKQAQESEQMAAAVAAAPEVSQAALNAAKAEDLRSGL
jgi:hypothetical protein